MFSVLTNLEKFGEVFVFGSRENFVGSSCSFFVKPFQKPFGKSCKHGNLATIADPHQHLTSDAGKPGSEDVMFMLNSDEIMNMKF